MHNFFFKQNNICTFACGKNTNKLWYIEKLQSKEFS
jgi:hypothetical protein